MGKTIKQEIERKFKVKRLPYDIKNYNSAKIEQSYLNGEFDRNTIRVRKYEDGRCYLEIKGPGTLSRQEIGFKITIEEYEQLKTSNEIKKTRYKIPSLTTPGMIIFVDVFEGELSGLILAEVEVVEEDKKNIIIDYVPDSFLGREVTDDLRYTNHKLSFSQKIPN